MTNQGDASIVIPAAKRARANANALTVTKTANTATRRFCEDAPRSLPRPPCISPERGIASRVPLVPLKGGFMKLRLLALLASCASVAAVAGVIRVW
jgi:hypothetical protein